MERHFADDIATGGEPEQLLRIGGRPRQGQRETYIILEEPDTPVLMHYRGRQVPHFKRDCPNCKDTDKPRPFWYVGASQVLGTRQELVIVELTWKCFESMSVAARTEALFVPARDVQEVTLFDGGIAIHKPAYRGLLVDIKRADFASSPRHLRCEFRRDMVQPWNYRTREELARIWGIPMRPRLYRTGEA